MKIFSKIITGLLVLGFISFGMKGMLLAMGDIEVSFRFYEGLKGDKASKSSVVTSYRLIPIFVGNLMSAVGIDKEKEELKRIFNLNNVKLLNKTHWAWKENTKNLRHQSIFLNDHEFVVYLALAEKEDGVFKLEIIEKGKTQNKSFLKTSIRLGEESTGVFGFEDSLKKSFFLSLHREKDAGVIREDLILLASSERPGLIHRVMPEYPEEAIKNRVEDVVVLDIGVDANGLVQEVKEVRGHPLLRDAAVKAVKQWKYEPFILNGKAKEVLFTVDVAFSLDSRAIRKAVTPAETKFKSDIPNIWPTRGYLTSAFGNRLHPVTKKKNFHKGVDVATKLGNPVLAAANGKVVNVNNNEVEGNFIVIQHKKGYSTYYGRLKSFKVKKGDVVKQGEVIGFVGDTGRSTGPHLHYEIRLNNKPIDPEEMIKN